VIAVLVIVGEYVALASLGRGVVTRGDQHFVGVVTAICITLLLLPILVSRAWDASPPSWSITSRATFATTIAALGYVAAVILISVATP
jgi:aspartokinase-like uncharacterized kinase